MMFRTYGGPYSVDEIGETKRAQALSVFWLLTKIAIIVILGSTAGIVPVYQGF